MASSLGFNFGGQPSAAAAAPAVEPSKKKDKKVAKTDVEQATKTSFDAELDGLFKTSVAFVPPKVSTVVVKKRVVPRHQKDQSDDEGNESDEDGPRGGRREAGSDFENDGPSNSDEFVDGKIRPRKKKQKQAAREEEQSSKPKKKIDRLEEKRLRHFEKQKEIGNDQQTEKEKRKGSEKAKPQEEEEEDSEDQASERDGNENDEDNEDESDDDEDEDDEDSSGEEEAPKKKADKKEAKKTQEETPKKRKHDSDDEDGEEEKKKKVEKKADPEKDARTIFVGNLPISVLEKSGTKALKKKFVQYGLVESVRFRSIAFAAPNIPKKFAIAQKKLHPERDNLNGYIVFKEKDSVEKALVENGAEFEGKHIRVDRVVQEGKKDNKRSVFVGNINFKAKEEDLREFFKDCGEIANVRLVRDKALNIGKGFGFVLFKERSSVPLALELNGTDFGGRPIRITHSVDADQVEKMKKNPKSPKKGGKFNNKRGDKHTKPKKTRKFEGERSEVGKPVSLRKKVGSSNPVIGKKKKARTRGPDYFQRKEERRKNKKSNN